MAVESRNIINPNIFFPPRISGQAVDKKPTFVDVGGTGDCGFRSVAAGFIDYFLIQPSRLSDDLLARVLRNHFKYFPKHRASVASIIPSESMEQLIRIHRMSELVQTFAYTLRQMTVDDLCAHPELYRGAFIQAHEETSPEKMRQATTWIDESSIAALSKTLEIPIDVVCGEVRKRLRYNEDLAKPSVVIRLQGAHYMPCLIHHERFTLVQSQAIRLVQPQADAQRHDPSLSAILTKIAAEDKRLIKAFDATYHRLTFMLANQELDKDDLLAIYIKFIPTSDYLSNRAKHAGIEHGHQDFFNLIMNAQKGDASWTRQGHMQMTHELVHAISRAISIGHLSEDVIDQYAHTRSLVNR